MRGRSGSVLLVELAVLKLALWLLAVSLILLHVPLLNLPAPFVFCLAELEIPSFLVYVHLLISFDDHALHLHTALRNQL